MSAYYCIFLLSVYLNNVEKHYCLSFVVYTEYTYSIAAEVLA